MFSISNILYTLCGLAALFLSKDIIYSTLFDRKAKIEESQAKIFAKILPVEVSKVQRYIKVSGNLNYRGFVKVKPERRGLIKYLNQSQFSKTGDPLVELDSAAEEANLLRYTGALNKAEYNLNRAKQRAKQPGFVAEAEMQSYESEYQIALGDKKRAEADLEKMKIQAPFDGKIGIFNFNVGAYVNENDIICNYVSYEDMIVDFVLTETEALNAYPGKKVLVSSNLFSDKIFMDAIIEKVDPSADVTYGIKVRARISNKDDTSKLSAGSSVTVSLLIDNDQPVPNVNENAVDERSGTNYMYIANPNDNGSYTVYRTAVEVQSRTNGRAILSFAKSPEKVFYCIPVPGQNLDGKTVFPTPDSEVPTQETEANKVVSENMEEAKNAQHDAEKHGNADVEHVEEKALNTEEKNESESQEVQVG